MSAVFNKRASAVLDAKLLSQINAGINLGRPTSSASFDFRRESTLVDGVTNSDSVADEFCGHPLTDSAGTRDLATLPELSEETILKQLEIR